MRDIAHKLAPKIFEVFHLLQLALIEPNQLIYRGLNAPDNVLVGVDLRLIALPNGLEQLRLNAREPAVEANAQCGAHHQKDQHRHHWQLNQRRRKPVSKPYQRREHRHPHCRSD